MALLTTIALTIGGALVKHVAAGYIGMAPRARLHKTCWTWYATSLATD